MKYFLVALMPALIPIVLSLVFVLVLRFILYSYPKTKGTKRRYIYTIITNAAMDEYSRFYTAGDKRR